MKLNIEYDYNYVQFEKNNECSVRIRKRIE